MQTKSLNTNLRRASEAKNDEFYTQLSDIEKELKHYKNQFRGKVVYCNCDDPFGDLGKTLGVTKNYRGRTDISVTINGKTKCPFSRIIIKPKKTKI